MGRDAAVTKRLVLTKVEDCRQAVNQMIGAVETLETQHNALCQAQDLAHADLERRATAVSAWCESNEKVINGRTAYLDERITTLERTGKRFVDNGRETDRKAVAATIADNNTYIEARIAGDVERIDELINMISDVLPPVQTFWGRLRWLVFGPAPKVEHSSGVPAHPYVPMDTLR